MLSPFNLPQSTDRDVAEKTRNITFSHALKYPDSAAKRTQSLPNVSKHKIQYYY